MGYRVNFNEGIKQAPTSPTQKSSCPRALTSPAQKSSCPRRLISGAICLGYDNNGPIRFAEKANQNTVPTNLL